MASVASLMLTASGGPFLDSTPAEQYFTADNVDRYREAASQAGIAELGVSEHIHRFAAALEVWDGDGAIRSP